MKLISKFDLLPLEELINIIKQSDSYREVIIKVGLNGDCGNHSLKLKSIIRKFNIDVSHMTRKCNVKKFIQHNLKKPIEKYLIKTDKKLGTKLKNRLIKENVIKNICSVCGQQPFHNRMILTLQLDHIDGDPTNNCLENLRLLCPNCHTQTHNWGSKNSKVIYQNKIKKERKCKFHITKEEMENLIKSNSMKDIGKLFNVTSNSIKKRCKKLGIEIKPYYYWKNKLYRHSITESIRFSENRDLGSIPSDGAKN